MAVDAGLWVPIIGQAKRYQDGMQERAEDFLEDLATKPE